jgi:arginine decarboxylase
MAILLPAFLVGATEIRDLHNLGDTNAVHGAMSDTDEVILEAGSSGAMGSRGVEICPFSSDALLALLRRDVEKALRDGRIGYEESGQLLKFYEEGLHGYTYLEDVHER